MLETNYKFGEAHQLASQIESDKERVRFKSIFSNDNGGVALIAFKEGQKLDEHVAPAELMVNVIEGEIIFSVQDHPHVLSAGEFLLLGKDVRHAVTATTDAKVMLVKIKQD